MTANITNEKGVKRVVKKLLTDHGWFWWMPSANGYGTPGVADFCAVRGGVFLAVETKFKKNKPTAQQRAFLTSVTSESAMALIVRETTLETFAGWLQAFDTAVAAESKGERPEDSVGAYLIDALRILQMEFV